MSGGGKESGRMLHEPGSPDGAAPTFDAVLSHLEGARKSVEIHMYVWRSDAIGNRIGRAVLTAAERGVKVRIIKDLGAFMYERIEMNGKSFFNREISRAKELTYRLIGRTFPDTSCEDDSGFEVGDAIMAHPNVEMCWVNKTHTKYYVFDEEILVTGSINIEDRHRGYYDYMIELRGPESVARFRHRMDDPDTAFDPERSLDFVCNAHREDGKQFEIKDEILRRLDACRESVYIEMAYIGDEDVSRGIVEAARRGVRVTFLFSKEANIGNDINYRTIHRIFCEAPVEVYRTPKMIHSKLMLFDDEVVVMGSCNLSVFSLQKAGELSLVFRGSGPVLDSVRVMRDERIAASQKVEAEGELTGYNPAIAALQQLHQKWNPN